MTSQLPGRTSFDNQLCVMDGTQVTLRCVQGGVFAMETFSLPYAADAAMERFIRWKEFIGMMHGRGCVYDKNATALIVVAAYFCGIRNMDKVMEALVKRVAGEGRRRVKFGAVTARFRRMLKAGKWIDDEVVVMCGDFARWMYAKRGLELRDEFGTPCEAQMVGYVKYLSELHASKLEFTWSKTMIKHTLTAFKLLGATTIAPFKDRLWPGICERIHSFVKALENDLPPRMKRWDPIMFIEAMGEVEEADGVGHEYSISARVKAFIKDDDDDVMVKDEDVYLTEYRGIGKWEVMEGVLNVVPVIDCFLKVEDDQSNDGRMEEMSVALMRA